MPTTEWFFSTLAQSVAASIGFVIAFVAAFHTHLRQIEMEIRRDVHSDMSDQQEIIRMCKDFRRKLAEKHGHPPVRGFSSEHFKDSHILISHFDRLLAKFGNLQDTHDLSKISELLGIMVEDISEINSIINNNQELYSDINQYYSEYYEGHSTKGNNFGDGMTLRFETILNKLSSDAQNHKRHIINSDVQKRRTKSIKLILKAMALFGIGVIIPTGLLITPSGGLIPHFIVNYIQSSFIYIEVGLLSSVTLISAWILRDLIILATSHGFIENIRRILSNLRKE